MNTFLNTLMQPGSELVALGVVAVAVGVIAWLGRRGAGWGSGPPLFSERPDPEDGDYQDTLRLLWPTVDPDGAYGRRCAVHATQTLNRLRALQERRQNTVRYVTALLAGDVS